MARRIPGRALDSTTGLAINNVSVGSNLTVNTSAIFLGNSTVNTVVTSSSANLGNTNITGFINVSTNTATFGTAMYVAANGNVGVGTAAPNTKFTVSGDGLISGSLAVGTDAASSDADLEIGTGRTANGYAYVDLIGDTTYTDYGLRLIRGNSGQNATSQLAHRGTGELQVRTNDAAPLQLITNSAVVIHAAANGNVGIGTTTPNRIGFDSNARVLTLAGPQRSFFEIGSESPIINDISGGIVFNSATNIKAGLYCRLDASSNGSLVFLSGGNTERVTLIPSGNFGINTIAPDYRLHVKESGITAAAISTGWPHYNAESAVQSKNVIHLDAGGNGNVSAAGQGPSAALLIGQYWDSRGIITMLGAGGASPSDQGIGYGKDLMVKGGNSDNTNGAVGGRLYLAGGSGYSGGAFNANYGAVIIQPQGGNLLTPNQPFFYADTVSGSAGGAVGSVVVRYTNIRQSRGTQGYNTSTGRFTAPVAGVYHFDWVYLYQNADTGMTIDDGYNFNGTFIYGGNRFNYEDYTFGDGYVAVQGHATVYLNASDYFEVKTSNGGDAVVNFYSQAAWGYLQGYLVG